MPNAPAYRAKIGVITPSTNTAVEHDVNALGLPGVSFHVGRMYIERPQLDSDETFEDLLGQVLDSMDVAIRDVVTCEPDHLILGMSAPAFWGGTEGAERMSVRVRERSGLDVTTPATAAVAALRALGLRRIAILTPYQPVADENVRRYFTESGFDVVRLVGMRVPLATEIAKVDHTRLIPLLQGLDGDDVDGVLQVGADLSMGRLADEATRWLRKPVTAINVATVWHAVRRLGIDDRFPGFGPLFLEH